MRDVGPNFGTHMPDGDARGIFILLVLDQLSRKLDASCTTVKMSCAETFSDLLKLFSRGHEGVDLFCTHMQATDPIP